MTGNDLKTTLADRISTTMIADVDSERDSFHTVKSIAIGHIEGNTV